MSIRERLFRPTKDSFIPTKPEECKTLNEKEFSKYPEYQQIRSRAIKELIPTIHTILSEIKDDVLNEKYSMLIGDDTSGRIPTLILRGAINKIREENGKKPLPTFFIRGEYGRIPKAERKRLTNQINSISQRDARALIITDFMKTGLHTRRIGRVVYKTGNIYDVAAISRDEKTLMHPWFSKNTYQSIYPRISPDNKQPHIFNKPELTGLQRDKVNKVQYPYREFVIKARADVQTSIQLLLKKHT